MEPLTLHDSANHKDGNAKASTQGGDFLDRALTIQLILRQKGALPGRGYCVTEDEIREWSKKETQ